MANKASAGALRKLPSIDEVLKHAEREGLANGLPHEAMANAARQAVGTARQRILATGCAAPGIEEVTAEAGRIAASLQRASLRRVINASGVIVHTNLGRSALAREAIDAVNDVIVGYSTLEYDMQRMERGSRHDHCEALICQLTGAEAAMAVNNNAAAVMMVLSEFAAGREAIVSRGELVEIGGSFRIPDIMRLSRALMVEVGTTNKTHAADYELAMNADTAMLLKVHPSNYRMIGFTESVSVSKLKELAQRRETPDGDRPLVYEDQGSGAFLALEAFGAYAEPTVAASLDAGADLVSFSGDKLLGGPQAGIIVGRRDLIDRLRANPLARALRLDKMTLAALEATLRLYLNPDEALRKIPTLRMLTEDAQDVRQRAKALGDAIARLVPEGCAEVNVVPEISRAGGGALPMCDIPTFALEVRFLKGNAQDCGRYLVQECPIPIVVRINHESVLLDARTLADGDELRLAASGIASYFQELV